MYASDVPYGIHTKYTYHHILHVAYNHVVAVVGGREEGAAQPDVLGTSSPMHAWLLLSRSSSTKPGSLAGACVAAYLVLRCGHPAGAARAPRGLHAAEHDARKYGGNMLWMLPFSI